MKSYRINDIFYSLQGEGHNTGRAAVFIRFAGCNLRCPFCDTEFDSYHEMRADELMTAIADYPARFVVLTGGEPTLQVDEDFVDQLHQQGYEVAMESNGTHPAPSNLDWLTVSPKQGHRAGKACKSHSPNEIKIVFDGNTDPEVLMNQTGLLPSTSAPLLYLQPCDTGNAEQNARLLHDCIAYIKAHPQWRLSLQTHKLTGIQ